MCKKIKPTSKEIFIKGVREYKDKNGDIHKVNEIDIIQKDINFSKVWLSSMIYSLEPISSKKTKVAYFILENMTKDNILSMTQDEIAKFSGVSARTVTDTIKILTGSNFIIKERNGRYVLNPDMCFKGYYNKDRMDVLIRYRNKKEENVVKCKKKKIS